MKNKKTGFFFKGRTATFCMSTEKEKLKKKKLPLSSPN